MNRTTRKSVAFVAALVAASGAAAAQQISATDVLRELEADLRGAGGGGFRSQLVIVTDNSQQQIEIEVGPVPGEVRVYGVNGASEWGSFSGVTAIDLTTGAAQDYVEFRVFAPVAPDIAIDTGAGNSDVKIIYQLPGGTEPASTDVSHVGAGGNDKTAFIVESLGADLAASWSVSHGNGFNDALVQINSPEDTASLAVDLFAGFGSGDDKLDVQVVHAAAFLDLAIVGRMFGGNDTFTLGTDGLTTTSLLTHLDVNLGGGSDTATTEFVSRGGASAITGVINGALGDDFLGIKLEGDGRIGARLVGGAGNDYLDMYAKGRVGGRPRLLAGAGDDFLKLVIDGPRVAQPYLDGGVGYDEAIGFGTIVNVEKIN